MSWLSSWLDRQGGVGKTINRVGGGALNIAKPLLGEIPGVGTAMRWGDRLGRMFPGGGQGGGPGGGQDGGLWRGIGNFGMGATSGFFGNPGNKWWDTGTQSGSQGLDPQTQAWKDQLYRQALASGGAMPEGVTQGMDALLGKSGAVNQFMNPYQQQVIDQMNKQYGVGNEMAMRSVNDAATRSGAFGGSRHGIATGTALAENARNRDQQMAGLYAGGFESAMGRAGQAVNLGMGGAGSPEAWRYRQLLGMQGTPYGQTYSGTTGRTSTSLFG